MPDRNSRFAWDDSTQRYRDAASGRFVPQTRVRSAVDALASGSAADARALTERLLAGDLDLAAWQAQMAELVKSAHVAGGLAAVGGRAQATQADYGWLGQRIRGQYGYLRDFAAQLASGEQLPNGVALRRAEMYAEAARSTEREMERRQARLAGQEEERSILGPADHCAGCLDAAAAGWQPIGSLPAVGSRDCLSRCRCHFAYRVALGVAA